MNWLTTRLRAVTGEGDVREVTLRSCPPRSRLKPAVGVCPVCRGGSTVRRGIVARPQGFRQLGTVGSVGGAEAETGVIAKRGVVRARRAVVLAAALGAVAIVAGCVQEEAATPIACLDGPEPLLTALERAPEPVRLGGGAEDGVG